MGLSISRSLVDAHGGQLWPPRTRPHGHDLPRSLPSARTVRHIQAGRWSTATPRCGEAVAGLVGLTPRPGGRAAEPGGRLTALMPSWLGRCSKTAPPPPTPRGDVGRHRRGRRAFEESVRAASRHDAVVRTLGTLVSSSRAPRSPSRKPGRSPRRALSLAIRGPSRASRGKFLVHLARSMFIP